MSTHVSDVRPAPDQVLVDIADYVVDYRIRSGEAFETARRPIVDKLVAAADSSAAWYDRFPEHMNLSPRDFAWSYIQRSGRIDPERLAKISPEFAKT